MAKLSEDQRTTVVRLLKGGRHGRNEIARLAGVGQASVTRIAQAEGLSTHATGADQSRQKQLARAREDYNLSRRLSLINRLADQVEELLEAGDLSARDLQSLAVTLGILTDKRRLDTGVATQRHDHRHAVVTLVLPDDGRLSPEKRAELLGQSQARGEQVILTDRAPTSDELDELVPPEVGETRVVLPSNGRGMEPVGSVRIMRSWPENRTGQPPTAFHLPDDGRLDYSTLAPAAPADDERTGQ